MFFARNYRGGPDPHLGIKSAVFVVGAALALGGMVFEVGWLVTVAIVLLATALIGARIARGRHADAESASDESADGPGAGRWSGPGQKYGGHREGRGARRARRDDEE